MMRRHWFAALAIGAGIALSLPGSPITAALAQDFPGTYRVHRISGSPLEGEVTEDGDSYRVKVKAGIVVTIKKSEVRKLEAVESDSSPAEAPNGSLRRPVTDAELEAVLGSEDIELTHLDPSENVDLLAELPQNPVSEQEMLRITGPKGKLLYTKHFVVAYTSDIESARKLASRLDSVFAWHVKFMDMLDLPKIRPASKLEIFYFGTFDEYDKYQTVNGFREMGAIGFYMRTNNRSSFFDMRTWPPFAAQLESAKDPSVDWRERQRIQNRVLQLVEHNNLEVVQHEAAHHIQFNIGVFPKLGDMPRWVTEGMATMFEVPPSEVGASLGALNHYRLFQFRQIWGPRGQRLPQLRQFILNDNIWFNFGGASYPAGWAINQYLFRQHPEGFKKWMHLMAQREDNEQVSVSDKLAQFEDIFGEVDEIWESKFYDYLEGLELKTSHLPVEGP